MATVTRCYEIVADGGAYCTTRAVLPDGTFSRVWDVTLAEAALIDQGAILTPAEEALVLTPPNDADPIWLTQGVG